MIFETVVNGFPLSASFHEEDVRSVFLPLLRHLSALRAGMNRRLVVFLAAPPGAGKSTLAAFLEHLSRSDPSLTPLQALGMDGFHFPQAHILTHTVIRDGLPQPMKRYKGAPDTFDVTALRRALCSLASSDPLWPVYDRTLHDVVPDALPVTAPIALVEGNYLLLSDPHWRGLPHDVSLFVEAEEALLRPRLLARKIRGGLSADAAQAHYLACDGPNVQLCLSCRLPATLTLRLSPDGRFLPR